MLKPFVCTYEQAIASNSSGRHIRVISNKGDLKIKSFGVEW